jgi:hypothetical protein
MMKIVMMMMMMMMMMMISICPPAEYEDHVDVANNVLKEE